MAEIHWGDKQICLNLRARLGKEITTGFSKNDELMVFLEEVTVESGIN